MPLPIDDLPLPITSSSGVKPSIRGESLAG